MYAERLILGTMLSMGVLFASDSLAQEHESSREPSHEQSHEFHRNTAAIFIGSTQEGREEDLTIAIEYERRINEAFGIGGLIERTMGNLGYWIYGVPFSAHSNNWKFYLAPGLEDGEHGSEFLFRLGLEYAFELNDGWEVSPQFNVDFVNDEEVIVFGILIGKGY